MYSFTKVNKRVKISVATVFSLTLLLKIYLPLYVMDKYYFFSIFLKTLVYLHMYLYVVHTGWKQNNNKIGTAFYTLQI